MEAHNVSQVFGFLPNFMDYCVNSTFTCDNTTSPCRSPLGMQFSSLWTITQNYYSVCTSSGAWLFNSTSANAQNSLAITKAACYSIAGKGYTPYAKADIWSRLTTWKFPLIQLIAVAPRPPLGLKVELLAVFHLAADPVGCLSDLLWKFECCQRRAVFWQNEISHNKISARASLLPGETAQQERLWAAIAIITESYDELGHNFGKDAENALLRALSTKPTDGLDNGPQDTRRKLLAECLTTGGALAADRSTTLLPVFIALAIFISLFFIDIIRLQPNGHYNPSSNIYVNVEMHSIGFSALFYWLIPAVAMTAVIGTSQTEEAIPRILRRFHRDLKNAKIDIPLPDLSSHTLSLRTRWMHGGIYTFQPLERHRLLAVRANTHVELQILPQPLKASSSSSSSSPFSPLAYLLARLRYALLLSFWPAIYPFLPVTTFLAAIATGMLNSGFVPPRGWSCRSWGELYFAFGWLASYFLSFAFSHLPATPMFWAMLVKDLATTAAAAAWILATQIGFYNRCDCYSRFGHTGLILPEQPDAYAQLQSGLVAGGAFVTVLVLGILFQLVLVPGVICWRYSSAFATFTQRDKSSSEPSVLDVVSRAQSKVGHGGGAGAGADVAKGVSVGHTGGGQRPAEGVVSPAVLSPLVTTQRTIRSSSDSLRTLPDRHSESGLSAEEIELARLISRSLESDLY